MNTDVLGMKAMSSSLKLRTPWIFCNKSCVNQYQMTCTKLLGRIYKCSMTTTAVKSLEMQDWMYFKEGLQIVETFLDVTLR